MKSIVRIEPDSAVEDFIHAKRVGDMAIALTVSSAPYYHTVNVLELYLPLEVVKLMGKAISEGDAYNKPEHFAPCKDGE